MEDHHIHLFNNGIRLVHKQVNNTKIIHCGFVIDIGSRDEEPDQQGLAHFWEHMAFKGTTKRKAYHIINRLESVGGELNAFTTKEKICFYASVLEDHFDKAVELLCDITFDSVFPEKQIERERSVILDEISMYNDSPDDLIQDDFDEVVFGDHPLGKNILGTEKTLPGFNRTHFRSFIDENLSSDKIIFSVVGGYSLKKTLKIVEKYLHPLPVYNSHKERSFPEINYGREVIRKKNFGRSYCAIGRDAFPLSDNRRFPFFMLTNILGGPGMNSRLNLTLREKYGYVYSIDAIYNAYTDTGLAGILFGTEQRYLGRSIRLVLKELKKLREDCLGTMQLRKAKQQLKGQLAISEENNTSLMLMQARSLLDLKRIDSLEYVFGKIDRISSTDLMEVANIVFDDKELNYLIFQPN